MAAGFLGGCSTEELVARPQDASIGAAEAGSDASFSEGSSEGGSDGSAEAGTDTSHPVVVPFDAPFEARPPADATDETTDDACGGYCACMRRVCTKVVGYPYADDEQCLGVCRAFLARERTCWSQSCRTAESVDVTSVREHLCQHAWGTFGLNECP